MEILFCSATCCPGLPGWVEEEEDVMPRGGERAPRASFRRKTSLDSSVICSKTDTSVWLTNSCLNSRSNLNRSCNRSPCGPSPWPGPGNPGCPCGAPGCGWTAPVAQQAAAALWPAGTPQPAAHSCWREPLSAPGTPGPVKAPVVTCHLKKKLCICYISSSDAFCLHTVELGADPAALTEVWKVFKFAIYILKYLSLTHSHWQKYTLAENLFLFDCPCHTSHVVLVS